MNLGETLALLDKLKAYGATHFKSIDFEVTLGRGDSSAVCAPVELAKQETGHAPAAPVIPPVDMSQDTVANKEATEKLKGLIDSLKMDDSQLLDKIFPAGAGG